MKLTILLLTVASMQVSAKAISQINIHGKNVTLEYALQQIETQSHYLFFFKHAIVENKKFTSVDIINKSVENTLQILLSQQNLTYEIINKTII